MPACRCRNRVFDVEGALCTPARCIALQRGSPSIGLTIRLTVTERSAVRDRRPPSWTGNFVKPRAQFTEQERCTSAPVLLNASELGLNLTSLMIHLLPMTDPAAHAGRADSRGATLRTTSSRLRVLNVAVLLSLFASCAVSRNTFGQAASAAAASPSDEAATEQRRTQAKAKYERGADAYAVGRYKDAVDLFLAADKLSPSAPLSFNIARAEEKLGDTPAALRWYRDYLRRSPNVQNAADVRTRIAILASNLAKKGVQQLTVLSYPEGASVEIDAQPAVVAPWTGELSPGRHHLSFSRAGYSDAQRDVDLNPSEPVDVSVQLEQKSAASVSSAQMTDPSATHAPPTTDATARGPRLGVLPWVTLGVGAAALGGALTFELLRRSAEHDAEHASQTDYQSQLDREQGRQTAARVFLGVGGAFVITGGLMLLLDTKPKSPVASAGLMCLPGMCAASALGRF